MKTTQIVVPSMGESVSDATVKWLKKVGEPVRADEPLVELENDKVTLEVSAPAAGSINEIVVRAGGKVQVGAILGIFCEAPMNANDTTIHETDATVRTFHDVVRQKQRFGTRGATFFGFLIVALLISDAYSTAIRVSGFSAVLSGLLPADIQSYRNAFFLTLLTQLIGLALAAKILAYSPWTGFLRYELLATGLQIRGLFNWRLNQLSTTLREQDAGFLQNGTAAQSLPVLIFGAVVLVASWKAVDDLSSAISLSRLIGDVFAHVVIIVLTLLTAWTLYSIGRASLKDREAIWGGFLGVLSAAVSSAYSRPYNIVYATPKEYISLNGISDLQYWDAGITVILLLVAISVVLPSRHYQIANTIRLHMGSAAEDEPPTFKSSPSDTLFLIPLFLKIVAHNNAKLIVLARTTKNRSYKIVDFQDDRSTITLNDHDIRIWNLTSLEKKVAGKFLSIQDTHGYFVLKGSINTLSTTELYGSAGEREISVRAMTVAEQYLFLNKDLKFHLISAIQRSLNFRAAPLYDEIQILKDRIRKLETAVDVGDTVDARSGKPSTTSSRAAEPMRAVAFRDALDRHERRIAATALNREELGSIEAAYTKIVRSVGTWSTSFNDWWLAEVLADMKRGTNIESLLEEVEKLFGTIGLRLADVRVEMMSDAANLVNLLKDIEQKSARLLQKDEARRTDIIDRKDQKEDERLDEVVKAALSNPTTRGDAVVELAKTVLSTGHQAMDLDSPQSGSMIENRADDEQPT